MERSDFVFNIFQNIVPTWNFEVFKIMMYLIKIPRPLSINNHHHIII